MPLHLIKLCVGPRTLAELAAGQSSRLDDMRQAGVRSELMHVTRMTPKRAEELLDGGSIYWVIGGWLVARQRLLELRPVVKNGLPHCGLVLDSQILGVRNRQHRHFQGWRYLEPHDAPSDLAEGEDDYSTMPEQMRRDLQELGLI